MAIQNIIASRKEAQNIFQDIIVTPDKRIGFSRNNSIEIPNYFVQLFGINISKETYVKEIANFHEQLIMNKKPFIIIDESISNNTTNELSDVILKIVKPIENSALNNPKAIIDGLMIDPKTQFLEPFLGKFLDIINLYLKNSSMISGTQLKNFVLKLFDWYLTYVHIEIEKFNKGIILESLQNPVLIYIGDIKQSTEYFLYLCWSLGLDVLYFNPSTKPQKLVINNWSQVVDYKIYSKDFKYPDVNKNLTPNNLNFDRNQASTYIPIIIKYKTTNNIYNDFTSAISDRSGYIKGNHPTLPVFFYYVKGIHQDQNVYFNELYKLDRRLKNSPNSYVRFENQIPLSNDSVFIKSFSNLWTNFKDSSIDEVETLVTELCNISAFPLFSKETHKNIIKHALLQTLEDFISSSQISTIAEIKNFVMKILIWTKEYLIVPLNNFDFSIKNQHSINPKILYYGNIKKHEVYFLLFSSRIGADVVFFNTYETPEFSSIIPNDLLDFKIELPDKCRIQPFPTKELNIRSETVAYQASKEINEVLFDPESGLFKPWQLDDFKVKTVTLKSTLEEASTLWPIEARLRDNFLVKDDTVYIPNLFFKVSGVHPQKNEYWKMLASLSEQKYIKLINGLPFSNQEFSKTDNYLINYVLTKEKHLDITEVRNKQIYKYKHLKNATQNLILNTINSVITSKAYIKPLNEANIKNIILTLLNLPEDIIHLISSFDKPFVIPKLIIFDPNENIFNDSDIAIILFLHLIGLDIGIFTPTGYNNIENMVNSNYFDVYKLEEVDFNLNLPDLKNYNSNAEKGKSFFSSLFGLN